MPKSNASDAANKSKLFKKIISAVVVFIVAVVSIAICVKGESSRINEALSQLQVIRVNIKQVFNSEKNYKELGTDGITGNTIAISAGLFPDSMKKGDGASDIKNPWNGRVTLRVAKNDKYFTIVSENIPREACLKLAEMQDWSFIVLDNETGTSVKKTSAIDNCKDKNTLVFVSN